MPPLRYSFHTATASPRALAATTGLLTAFVLIINQRGADHTPPRAERVDTAIPFAWRPWDSTKTATAFPLPSMPATGLAAPWFAPSGILCTRHPLERRDR
jgi:hypothetical protein